MPMVSFPDTQSGREIYLNTDRIISLQESRDYGVSTRIGTDDGKAHFVRMTAAEVAEKINNMAKGEDESLRDRFAAKAMQALIHVQVKTRQAQTVETAYAWADAMMEARGI